MSTMTVAEISDFDRLNKIAKAGIKDFMKTGLVLIEIHDRKLYRRDWLTWETYLQRELGISEASARQTMKAVAVVQQLASENPQRATDLVITQRAALELGKVPEEKRAQVVGEASRNGPATAMAIKKAADKLEPEKPKQPCDRTGYPIPENVQPMWESAEAELGPLLLQISHVRSHIRKIMEGNGDGEPPWRQVSVNSAMIALDNAYREINAGVPFAVCYHCQGRAAKSCTACKQTGFIGKFTYSMVDSQLKAIREKATK